jgi:hypothetical protein
MTSEEVTTRLEKLYKALKAEDEAEQAAGLTD